MMLMVVAMERRRVAGRETLWAAVRATCSAVAMARGMVVLRVC